MATPQVPAEPLEPNLNIWEKECNEITEQLRRNHSDLEFNLIPFKEFIYVDLLIVPEDQRSQGRGTAFMQELVEAADEINCPLALTPDTTYGSSDEERLEEYYTRFGFVKNIGRDRDFSTNHKMIRPRKNG